MEDDLASTRLQAMQELQKRLAQCEKQNENLEQNIVEAYTLLSESNKELVQLRCEVLTLANAIVSSPTGWRELELAKRVIERDARTVNSE